MTGIAVLCIVLGFVTLWLSWLLRGLWGSVFGGTLAVTYLTVGVWGLIR